MTALAGRRPLHEIIGVAPEDMPVMRDLFTQAVAGHGLDGPAVFDRLAEGATLGEALAIPRGVADLLYAQAYQWFAIGQAEKAEPLFRALCLLDGGTADYWVGHGLCLRMRQLWEAAERALSTAAALRPDWEVPRFHLCELHIRREDWRRAKAELAAFEARAGESTPAPMRREAERFGAALQLK